MGLTIADDTLRSRGVAFSPGILCLTAKETRQEQYCKT